MTFFTTPTVSTPGQEILDDASSQVQRSLTLPVQGASVNKDSVRKVSAPAIAGRANSTLSLTSRVRNLLPRYRPERGGTVRRQGYWEEAESKNSLTSRARRRFTDSHQSRQSEAGSDRITRWNTAKDLSTVEPDEPLVPPAAGRTGSRRERSDSDRQRYSWLSPRSQGDEFASVSGPKGSRSSSPAAATRIRQLDFSKPDRWSLAQRRLSKLQRSIEMQNTSRRSRRNLMESGDYLGVQGINPDTGELDLISPTDSEGSAAGLERELKIREARRKLKDEGSVDEVEQLLTELESQIEGNEGRAAPYVRWRRKTKQWCLAQNPALSPVAQSRRTTLHSYVTPGRGDHKTTEQMQFASPVSADAGEVQPSKLVTFANIGPTGLFDNHPESSSTIVCAPNRQSAVSLSAAVLELLESGLDLSGSSSDMPSSRGNPDLATSTVPYKHAFDPGHHGVVADSRSQFVDDVPEGVNSQVQDQSFLGDKARRVPLKSVGKAELKVIKQGNGNQTSVQHLMARATHSSGRFQGHTKPPLLQEASHEHQSIAALHPRWVDGQADGEWAKDTIRDIVKCSTPSPGRDSSASIPIITTTGTAQTNSQDHLELKSFSTNGMVPQVARLSEEERQTKHNVAQIAILPTQTSPSTLLKLGLEGARGPADITSTPQARLRMHVQKAVTPVRKAAIKVMPIQHYMASERSALARASRNGLPPGSFPSGTNGAQSRPVVGDQKAAKVPVISTPRRKLLGTLLAQTPGGTSYTQIRHVPGEYPDHNEDEDIVDLIKSLLNNIQGIEIPRLMLAWVRMICACSLLLAQAYLKALKPVTDAKSEYWRRKAANEATWEDGLKTLLATPVAVMACASFVWALNLAVAVSERIAKRL